MAGLPRFEFEDDEVRAVSTEVITGGEKQYPGIPKTRAASEIQVEKKIEFLCAFPKVLLTEGSEERKVAGAEALPGNKPLRSLPSVKNQNRNGVPDLLEKATDVPY